MKIIIKYFFASTNEQTFENVIQSPVKYAFESYGLVVWMKQVTEGYSTQVYKEKSVFPYFNIKQISIEE